MLNETCEECSTEGACPFSFTAESEYIQNMGCLPTPMQIVAMRQYEGRTWACHSNPTKPCLGAIKFQQEHGLDASVTGEHALVTEDSPWHLYVEREDEACAMIQALDLLRIKKQIEKERDCDIIKNN